MQLLDQNHNHNHRQAKLLGETLNEAVGKVLDNNKSPSRKVNEIDNRGSTFYIALYWAKYVYFFDFFVWICFLTLYFFLFRSMAAHDSQFADLAAKLEAGEEQILNDLIKCQVSFCFSFFPSLIFPLIFSPSFPFFPFYFFFSGLPC